ncbi:Glycosyl transferases group 1 [compost metagenome]
MNEFKVKNSDLREKLNIPEKSKVILYASRLENKKYRVCRKLLMGYEKKLLKKFPDVHLLVAGGGLKTNQIKDRINKKINSNRIQYIGNRVDMPDLYAISNYVVGTGRIALEAIFCERPVIAIGSTGTFGLVKPNNLKKALKYYFCDHKSYYPLDKTNIVKAVKKGLLSKKQKLNRSTVLRERVVRNFEVSLVTNELRKIYLKKLQKEEGM